MTVRDLINVLLDADGQDQVVISTDNGTFFDIKSVSFTTKPPVWPPPVGLVIIEPHEINP